MAAEDDNRVVRLSRMEAFSDGVFSIAITLLCWRLGRAEFTARRGRDTARFRLPASGRATQDMWYGSFQRLGRSHRRAESQVRDPWRGPAGCDGPLNRGQ
jgi:hypothetical protein